MVVTWSKYSSPFGVRGEKVQMPTVERGKEISERRAVRRERKECTLLPQVHHPPSIQHLRSWAPLLLLLFSSLFILLIAFFGIYSTP